MNDDRNRSNHAPSRNVGDATRRMPHERDEFPDRHDAGKPTKTGPRAVIDQASTDVERGLRDAEARGTPSDVPAPNRNRRSQGADARTSRRQRGSRAKDHP